MPAWGVLLQLGCKGSPGALGTGLISCPAFHRRHSVFRLAWWHREVLLQVIQSWFSSSLELAQNEIPCHEEQGQHTVAGVAVRGMLAALSPLPSTLQGSADVRPGTGHGGSGQVRPQLRLSMVSIEIILHSSIFKAVSVFH